MKKIAALSSILFLSAVPGPTGSPALAGTAFNPKSAPSPSQSTDFVGVHTVGSVASPNVTLAPMEGMGSIENVDISPLKQTPLPAPSQSQAQLEERLPSLIHSAPPLEYPEQPLAKGAGRETNEQAGTSHFKPAAAQIADLGEALKLAADENVSPESAGKPFDNSKQSETAPQP